MKRVDSEGSFHEGFDNQCLYVQESEGRSFQEGIQVIFVVRVSEDCSIELRHLLLSAGWVRDNGFDVFAEGA